MTILEPRDEDFIQEFILNGGNRTQAYIKSHKINVAKWKPESINCEASKLFNSPKIHQRYIELLEENKETYISNVIEKRKMLKDMMLDEKSSLSDRLKAVDIDNKMDGSYQENINISGNVNNPFVGLSKEELDNILNEHK